jgi:hypothetical protein
MTLEYVLLLSVFAMTLGVVLSKGPKDSFKNSGPRLAARVEKALVTGDGFKSNGAATQWQKPTTPY